LAEEAALRKLEAEAK
jgi:hypothetical protein